MKLIEAYSNLIKTLSITPAGLGRTSGQRMTPCIASTVSALHSGRAVDELRLRGDRTRGSLIHGFVGRPEIADFGGSGWPLRPPKTIPEGGGLRPPPFGMVVGAAGAAQTPKLDDFRPAPKTMY